jgi:hypothetical protein
MRILSNLARIAFLSCRRRVPFLSWTSSSFGRLIAIVLEPAFASPATYTTSYAFKSDPAAGVSLLYLSGTGMPRCSDGKSATYFERRWLHSLSLISTKASWAALYPKSASSYVSIGPITTSSVLFFMSIHARSLG